MVVRFCQFSPHGLVGILLLRNYKYAISHKEQEHNNIMEYYYIEKQQTIQVSCFKNC